MIPLRDTVPARRLSIMNWAIIAANVLVFIYMAGLGEAGLESFVMRFAAVPSRLLENPTLGQIFTLFSSMFMHGGWLHLISNMWALFIFGDNVEDRMGTGRYLLFYLLTGLAAAGLHIALSPGSSTPIVGASGAISGVMGAYMVLFPRARVVTLIPLGFIPWFVQIPALLYIGFWFVSQLFSGVLSLTAAESVETYGGVAWWAHVGGFVMGLILVKLFEDRRTYSPHWNADEYRPW